jgi:hypothetical protein
LYAYVGGRPTAFTDPAGLAGEKISQPGENRPRIPFDDGAGHKGVLEVNVGAGVEYEDGNAANLKGEKTGGLSIGATCSKPGDSTVVQVFWTEVFVSRGAERTRKTGVVGTSAGDVTLTADPTKPVWHVDGGKKTPAYDEDGFSIRGPSGITIWDRPNMDIARQPLLADEVADATVTNIRKVTHFASFLVCAGKVVAGFAWTQSNSWNQKTKDYGYRLDVEKDQKGDLTPDPGQAGAIRSRYPGQTTIGLPN